MLYTEHIYFIAPSTPLSIYLSITTLLDIAKTRSYFIRADMVGLAVSSVLVVTLKMTLVALEEVSKSKQIDDADLRRTVSREAVAGFWQKCFSAWLNSTFVKAFSKIITIDDLERLEPEFDSTTLATKFKARWNVAETKSRWTFFVACVKSMPRDAYFAFLPRLIYLALSFSRPFLIQRIMTAVVEHDRSLETVGGLIGATALVYWGLAVSWADANL